MPNFEETLNQVCKPYFDQVEENNYIPVEYLRFPEGFTGFFSNREDAYALNPPIAGWAKDLRVEPGMDVENQPVGDRFILRSIMGYAMAARVGSNLPLFTLQLSNLINGMVSGAYKVYGPRIQRLSFRRPNQPTAYFREIENNAGYEIRLYGELSPARLQFEMETVE